MNINYHTAAVKKKNTWDMVDHEFSSEITYTNQLFVNLNTMSSSDLSIIDVLSSNKYINLDKEMYSITMKDKNEVLLFINDVKIQVSEFQMFQLLNGMKANVIKTMEIINLPGYKTNFSTSTGIIKILK